MTDTKPKINDSLRTPKAKKKLGLTVPPALRLPHEDLMSAAREPESGESMTSLTSQTSHTSHTPVELPVAPVRDFTKVANSIGRTAVPAGLFTGKSKQLYDCLYSITRGAVVPSRVVRISRPNLMKKAGIGSRVTFDANIERLMSVGLISVRHITGEHEGNEYSVFLPEEVLASMPSQTSLTSLTSPAQKLDRLVRLETSQTRHTSSLEESTTYAPPKTSFKTVEEIFDDDDAFAEMSAVLRAAAREITGKNPSSAERERWRELGEILSTELKIAAARTTVSSVPAFLCEHLRRRLWKMDKKQQERETSAASVAGQPDKIEASQHCPDCGGTGFYYPNGYESGVTRCKHERAGEREEPATGGDDG